MVDLMAPRAIAKAAARTRQLEIDAEVLARARRLLESALAEGTPITRPDAYALFESHGLSAAGQRGIHILQVLAHQGLLCFGPHRGKQPTFVFVEQWLPPAPAIPREEALARLALRYFSSHGPATIHDFAWWTGLTLSDCRSAVESLGELLECVEFDGRSYWLGLHPGPQGRATIHLLPGFDEYILGYQDRTAILSAEQAKSIVPGNYGMFMATIVSKTGAVLGTWRRGQTASRVTVTPEPFGPLEPREAAGIAAAAGRYATFLGYREWAIAPAGSVGATRGPAS
jgi:hypothetical protein